MYTCVISNLCVVSYAFLFHANNHVLVNFTMPKSKSRDDVNEIIIIAIVVYPPITIDG